MNPIRLAIAGCTGRTGATVVRRAAAEPAFALTAALAHPDDPYLGQDAGGGAGMGTLGLPITSECAVHCDVLVEFTTPTGCQQWASWCAAQGVALVSGTTGLQQPEHAALRQAALAVPVVWSPNMSVGVNLLLALVAEVAGRLGEDWDVEITETHHRHKVDAPSGTAKALLESICAARGADPAQAAVFGRAGSCAPRPGQIGVHARRMGEIVGEHEVTFASAAEALTLQHRAFSRDTFAAGALRAARWAVGQRPGLYTMGDVLASCAALGGRDADQA
jgi:4-hydroxy-tetrahydrodipicolinate reductase